MDRHHHHHGLAPGLAAPELAHADHAGLASLGTAAAAPAGLTPPRKDEAHRLAGAAGLEGQGQGDSRDSGVGQSVEQLVQIADRKRFINLRAHLALAGWALNRTAASDGAPTYHATRWGMATPELPDLIAVEAFADRVGTTR